MSQHVTVDDRAHGDDVRAKHRQRIVEQQQSAVDRYLTEKAIDILLGTCPNPISEQRIDQLFAQVKKDVSGHKLKIRHNYLAQRLQEAALEHNLDLPNQQRMVVLHCESAPATPVGFQELSDTSGWVDGFWRDVENPKDRGKDSQLKLDAGRLLFSVIVFGGVHSRKKLQWLIKDIPKGVRHLDGLTWMDIDPSEGANNVETRQGLWRWFPDPVSMLLLQRWYKTYGMDQWPCGVNTDVARLVFNYLNFLDVLSKKEKKPKTVLGKLIDASATRDATWMEGVLHHIQRGHGATVSLPSDAWARLLTKKVPLQIPQTTEELETKPIADLEVLTGQCDADVYTGVSAIRGVLKQASRKSKLGERDPTYQKLTAIADDDSWAPIVRVLASWTAHLRRYGGRQKDLVISSIRSYLATIANPLATILSGTSDLNAMGEDEWEEVYDRLRSSAPSAKRRSSQAVVAGWFHQYMVEQYGMPEVAIEGVTVNSEVDANILTPAEYVRAHSMLEHSGGSSRLIKVRQIVLTLGFRCGVRRSEVQKILIKDLQGLMAHDLSRPELLTRGNKFDGQKSGSGTRRLPLWALLTEAELGQLQAWYQQRLREPNTKQNDLLFSAPQRGNQLIPQRHLFTPIQEVMRTASGTASLRFHHLRHSCVTLIGLRLFERRPGELMRENWAMDDGGTIVMPHWGKDIYAIANRSTAWAPTRKKLWFLAVLAGHASPGQTLLSYAHMMDYINGVRQAERRLPTLTLREQSSLLGLTLGSVDGFRNNNGLKGDTTARELAVFTKNRWPAGVCITAGKNLTSFKMPDLPALSERLNPDPYTAFMIYAALFLFNRMVAEGRAREEAIRAVEARFDLVAGTLEVWLELGTRLMQQRFHDGSQRSKYSRDPDKTAQTIALKNGVGGVTMPTLPECPAPPKAKLAQGLVEDIFERVRRWLREEPDAAFYALQTVSNGISSSKTQISYTLDEKKLTYLKFIEKAGFMHLAKVRVKAPESGGLSDREVKAHWSEYFKLPKARVVISSEASKGERFQYGSVQIEIRLDPKLGKGGAQNTMNAFKFTVFVLMMSCAGEAAINEAVGGEGL